MAYKNEVFEEFLLATDNWENFTKWAKENGHCLKSLDFSSEEEG